MSAFSPRLRRMAMRAISASTILFMLAPSVSARTLYWAGNYGNNSWESPTNWSTSRNGSGGAGAPGAGDTAEFNTGTGSKTVTIKSVLSVGGIYINNTWTGSILVGTGTLKVGTGGIRIGSGYFIAGANPISLSGSYTQTGGIVRGMQGNFSLSGSLSITSPGATSAFFTSTGTIIFSGNKNQTFVPLQRGRFTNLVVRNYNKAGSNSVIISTNNLALSGSLTIARGKLDLATNSKKFTVRGITLQSSTSGSLVTDSNVFNSGSVTIASAATLTVTAGTWTQYAQTATTLDFQGKPVYHFTLNNTGVSGSNTATLASALNMSGSLTLTNGILTTSTSNYGMSITGDVSNSSTFTANGSTISVGGSWTTQASATFNAGSSTVSMNGANKTLSGSTIFYNLSKSITANDTLNFAAGTTTRTTNRLTLATPSGTLSLRSTVSSQRFNITPDGNQYSIGTLDVMDSNATVTIQCFDCTNSGNNSSGWVFSSSSDDDSGSSGTSGGGGGGGGGGSGHGAAYTYSNTSTTTQTATETTSTTTTTSTTGGAAVHFRDVPSSAWFSTYVQQAIDAGIVSGYKDAKGNSTGRFGPANPVTYAEIAKMALLAGHQSVSDVTGSPANTSAKNDWSAAYIKLAEQLNLSVYGPSLNVKTSAPRGAVLQTVLEALKIPLQSDAANTFKDLPNSNKYAAAIKTAAALGIVSGDTDASGKPTGTFRPNAPIIRAEVAKILSLSMGKAGH